MAINTKSFFSSFYHNFLVIQQVLLVPPPVCSWFADRVFVDDSSFPRKDMHAISMVLRMVSKIPSARVHTYLYHIYVRGGTVICTHACTWDYNPTTSTSTATKTWA